MANTIVEYRTVHFPRLSGGWFGWAPVKYVNGEFEFRPLVSESTMVDRALELAIAGYEVYIETVRAITRGKTTKYETIARERIDN